MDENIKYYVVAENSENIVMLDECKTKYEADLMLEWYKMHMWLYADNVNLSVKASNEIFF